MGSKTLVEAVDNLAGIEAGSDSTGAALPTTFDSLGSTFTRNASGSIATESRTDGTNTWTQTYTRDGSDNITAISKWVKS